MASSKAISYEAARDELAEVVAKLESGKSSLEDSLKLWERGEELAKICQDWLDGAKAKLDKVKSEVDELDVEDEYEDDEEDLEEEE
jgi:exodeoxyribonuclease VII small subunit